MNSSREKPGRFIIFIFIALSGMQISLHAMDWPNTEEKLRSDFGHNDSGRPNVGLIFVAQGAVKSIDAGELVFVRESSDSMTALPTPLGSWVAIDHSDGLRSLYGRLEAFDKMSTKTLVEKGTVLGSVGRTGYSSENGFYFSLYDSQEQRWLNPSMVASPRPDKKAPQIRSTILVNSDKTPFNLSQIRTIRQGSYRILVDVVDTEDQGLSPSAPQRILCMINGEERGALHLETIAVKEGKLVVNQLVPTPAASAYAQAPAFDLGEARLTRGRSLIEIIARDASGNERISTYNLNVE